MIMKRIILLFVLMAYMTPVFANSIGYGTGFYAQTVETPVAQSNSGGEFSLVYVPKLLPYCNPSLQVKVAVGTDQDQMWLVPYVKVGIGLDLVRTINHPFNYFTHNVTAYSPSVGFFYQFDPQRGRSFLSIDIIPFKLMQKDFWYEFFSPFVSYDLSTGRLDNWGVNLVRYTFLFK